MVKAPQQEHLVEQGLPCARYVVEKEKSVCRFNAIITSLQNIKVRDAGRPRSVNQKDINMKLTKDQLRPVKDKISTEAEKESQEEVLQFVNVELYLDTMRKMGITTNPLQHVIDAITEAMEQSDSVSQEGSKDMI